MCLEVALLIPISPLQRCARDESKGDAASLKLALAVLRLSSWDADVFLKFKANIIDRSPAVSDRLAADMARDVAAVASRYYPLQTSKDVSFELGRVSMGLKRYADALKLFSASQRQCGEHHGESVSQYACSTFLLTLWLFLHSVVVQSWDLPLVRKIYKTCFLSTSPCFIFIHAICRYLGDFPAARDSFKASIRLRQDYSDATNWLVRVEAKLQGEVFAAASAGQ